MKAMKIVDAFCKPLDVYTIASAKLEACYNEIDELTKGILHVSAEHDEVATNLLPNVSREVLKEMNYQDPPQSQCKGKRKPERFKHQLRKR